MDVLISLSVIVLGISTGYITWMVIRKYDTRRPTNDYGVIKYKPVTGCKAGFCANRGHASTNDYKYCPHTNVLSIKLFEDLVIPDGLAMVVTLSFENIPSCTDNIDPKTEIVPIVSPGTYIISSGHYYSMYSLIQGHVINMTPERYMEMVANKVTPMIDFKITIISAPLDTKDITSYMRDD